MIYRLLKVILTYAIKTYFSEIQLRNEERIPLNAPVILLPNHRSAIMDALVVAAFIKRKVHFLARGESFRKPQIAWILRKLNLIPIYRKEQTPDELHKNKDVFKSCFQLLEQNGVLLVFPEGISQTKPILLPLKTGAARIAIGAASKNNFNLDVQLIPVGVNYTNPHLFRGKLFLNFGKPIKIKDYKEEYERNQNKAIQTLNDAIAGEIRNRIVVMDDDRGHELIENIEQIIVSDKVNFGLEKTTATLAWFKLKRNIAKIIDYNKNSNPEKLNTIEQRIQHYTLALNNLKLNKGELNSLEKKHWNPILTLPLIIFFIIGFPMYLVGFLIHFLPYLFANSIAKMVVKRDDFIGSINMVLGIVLFTLNRLAFTLLFYLLTKSLIFSLLFFIVLPLFGIFTLFYYKRLHHFILQKKLGAIEKQKLSDVKKLILERDALSVIFKSTYIEYLQYLKSKRH